MTRLTESVDLSKFTKRLVLAKIPYSHDNKVLWPCLMFENRKQLDENLDQLQLFDDNDVPRPGVPLSRVYKSAAATEFPRYSLALNRASNREDPAHVNTLTIFLLLGHKETPTGTRFVFGDHETLPYNAIDQAELFNLIVMQPGFELAHKHASSILGEDEDEYQRELPAELSSARFCFVEIEEVLWPATFLHDCNSLCDKLKSEGIIKSRGEAELFLREYIQCLKMSKALQPSKTLPHVIFLFGKPPISAGRFISKSPRDPGVYPYEAKAAKAYEYWKYPGFREALDQATSAIIPAPSVAAAPAVTNKQPGGFIFDEHYHEQRKVPFPVTKKKRKSKNGDITSTKPIKKSKAIDSRSKPKKRNPFTDATNNGIMHASEKDIYIETVPFFSDVKATLEKVGCVFRANLYCRPGKDPETDGSTREGHDYCLKEDDFRKDICAHGLAKGGRSCKGRKDMLDELEKAKLDVWIRFSIVKPMGHEHGMPNPPRPPIFKLNEHHSLLEKLGFIYKGGEYSIPGDSKRVSSIDQHISYFGLSDECHFDKISEDDCRRLEVHAAKIIRN
jgi:hypothetical protein